MSYEVIFWILFVVLIYAIHLFTNNEEELPEKEKKKEVKKENYEEFILDVIKDMKNERISLKDLGLSTEHKTFGSLRNYTYGFSDLDDYISEDNIVDYEGLVKYIAESKYNFGRWSKYISSEHPLHNNAKMNYYVIDLPFKRKSKEEKMIELMQVIVRIEKDKGFIFIDWYKDKDDDNLFHVKFKHSYDKKIYIKSGNISD